MDGDDITFTPVNGEEQEDDFSITPPHMDDAFAQRAVAVAYLLQTADGLSEPDLRTEAIDMVRAVVTSIPKPEPAKIRSIK